MRKRVHRPGATMVVALLALFVALGGVATAAAVVPLAKRALVADNAKKLGGKTLPQLTAATASAIAAGAALPSPASSAAGLAVVKTASGGQLAANDGRDFSIACDAGQKIFSGGFSSDGSVFNFDSYPQSDTTWVLYLANGGSTTANVTLYATCIK